MTDAQIAARIQLLADDAEQIIKDIAVPPVAPPVVPPATPPVSTPPPAPGQTLIPFGNSFVSMPLEAGDAVKNEMFQRYSDGGVWEAEVWSNKKPVTFVPQSDGSIVVTIDDDNGSFCYVNLCPETGMRSFAGGKVLHVRQRLQYHLCPGTRTIYSFYGMPVDDGDLVNTRTLQEWKMPFRTNGVEVFILDAYVQVRAYNSATEVFTNNPDKDFTARRTTSNGGPADFGLMRDFDFYFSKNLIRVDEGGVVKVNLAVNLNFEQMIFNPALGAYHLQNRIEDIHNGGDVEKDYLAMGMKDKRRFGPLFIEVLDAMPPL